MNLESSRVRKTITFDLYGCLLNNKLIHHFVGQVAREHNVEPALAENFFNLYIERVKYSSSSFVPYYDLLQRALLYVDMELNTNTTFVSHLDELFLLHVDIKPHVDVLPALHNLIENGYELYLIANTSFQLVQKQFDNFEGIFNEKNICVTDEVKTYKPNLDFFRFAAKKFKLFGTDHFHVSSNYFNDIIPANLLHWDNIYVNRNKTGIHQDYEPTLVIHNLTDLHEGMGYVRYRQHEEEMAAQRREEEEAEKLEAAKRAQELRARHEAETRRQEQALREREHRMQQQSLHDKIMDPHGFQEVIQNVNPMKARALSLAREKALAHARIRENLNNL